MFKIALSGFAVSALLLTAGGGDEKAVKKEMTRFKGTWTVVKFETGKGEKDDIKGAKITFAEDGTAEMRHDEKQKKATYKINPTAKPKEIDLKGENEEKVGMGIYIFEKDTLKICFEDGDQGKRPTEFAVKEGARTILITLQRAK